MSKREMDIGPFIKIVEGICELFEKEIYEENLNPLTKMILVNIFLDLGVRISQQISMFSTVNENNESNLNIFKLGARVAKIGIHLSEFGMEFSDKAKSSIEGLFSELNKNKDNKSKKEEEIIH